MILKLTTKEDKKIDVDMKGFLFFEPSQKPGINTDIQLFSKEIISVMETSEEIIKMLSEGDQRKK